MSIRQPVLAGSWYPGDPQALARQVDDFLAQADSSQRPAGQALVAISPHAGYAYSGPTAGRLFGLLRGPAPDRVILLAPNHRQALSQIALSSAEAFATPLGIVPLDRVATDRLAGQPGFVLDDGAHAQEHAVEILLPFLQRLWLEPDTPAVVPMLVPHLPAAELRQASATLGEILRELPGHSLLLVSSDFTHYGEAFGFQPFTDDIPRSLEALDSGAILRVLAADPEPLLEYGRETGITMCGLNAAALALGCGLPPGHEGGLIHYCRSGDRNGDYSHCVSYASILLTSGPTSAAPGAE